MASEVLQHQQFRTTNQSRSLIMTDQQQGPSGRGQRQPARKFQPGKDNDLSETKTAAQIESQTGGGPLESPLAGQSADQSPLVHVPGELNASADNADDPNKQSHHVGPVMGIFFKVWSLVKVTKVRHHNSQKIRRQNSEDTGHFQYISGDQLANPNNRRPLQLLNDGHFRRAGSQPAPSCSGGAELAAPASSSSSGSSGGQQRLLQAATNGSGGAANLTGQPSNNTNSSSSGVSSSTSSTLADSHGFNAATKLASCQPSCQPSTRRPGARKGRATEQVKQAGRANQRATTNSQQQPTDTTNKSTWTSKIKRSATTVNQSDLGSYVSRYRFRRPNNELPRSSDTNKVDVYSKVALAAQPPLQQPPPPSFAPQVTSLQANRHARAQSEANRADDMHKRRPRPRLWSRDAISVHDDDDDDDNYDASSNDNNLIDSMHDNDDSDLNDIYSTPNDSIHSVPNSAPLSGCGTQPTISSYFGPQMSFNSNGNLSHQQTEFAMNKNQSITKSFSANNFSQLIKQQQQQDNKNANHHQIDTIQEHQFQTPTNDKNNSERNNNQRLLLSANNETLTNNPKRLSGSRFFISSSSSEDSNPPSQLQQHQQTNGTKLTTGQQHPLKPPVNPTNIPINFGLHYHHEPSNNNNNNQVLVPIRPDSLQVGGGAQFAGSNFVHLGGFVTPSFTQIGCPPESAAIAVMSPAAINPPPLVMPASQAVRLASGYKKSPSLFEISTTINNNNNNNNNNINRTTNPITSRFSSKFPLQHQPLTSTFQPQAQQSIRLNRNGQTTASNVPNSISLHDCKLSTNSNSAKISSKYNQQEQIDPSNTDDGNEESEAIKWSEYKLAQMLLELGSNSSAKDQSGCTALMHAVLSENLPALKCLIEHGVDLNDTNLAGLSALDLICAKRPNELRIEMLKLLIDSRVDMDKTRQSDGTRLLDRLIAEHRHLFADKLAYIDCLLHNGAKLGSSTWLAANGKHEIQLRLLRKLCQDGYFLYKKSSIEPAVYRFEYALKRIAELEHQLASGCCARQPGGGGGSGADQVNQDQMTLKATQQIKYQTYLGLSRCERKRKFFKRALEFAHMSILVDSTAYEGYYSKAHILKDLGEIDESLSVIDQTARLVDKSVDIIKGDLNDLQHQEESIIFDGCFNMRDPTRSCWIEATRSEFLGTLDYLEEAKKHIARLREEILQDKAQLPVS